MSSAESERVLHLQVGDPVPSLSEVGGPDMEPLQGRYVLLATVHYQAAERLLEMAAAGAAAREVRGLEVIALCHGGFGDEGSGLYDDRSGRCALRLGARTEAGDITSVAVLVEPRGRVYASCSGADAPEAVEAALNALKAPAGA